MTAQAFARAKALLESALQVAKYQMIARGARVDGEAGTDVELAPYEPLERAPDGDTTPCGRRA